MKRRTFLGAGLAASASALRHPPFISLERRAVPSPAQLRWQRDEIALFVHFGVNTFTDREWGDGTESPTIFDPAALDAQAWIRAAKSARARALILTAKHHDGFCLWPSATTSHSVRSSPFRGGQGDVVREFTDACRGAGLGAGLYLSPWDRHEPSYGDSPRYNDFYIAQLTELLTRYGPLNEVWFDGANGEGPNGRRQEYDWPRIHRTVRALQPDAVIFSDAGPDVRWIGNEKGVAGETCWSTMDPNRIPYPGFSAPGVGEALQEGDPHGTVWRPGETDVSIRPGWFWHPAENERVRTVTNLGELYLTSVGRNSKLLLNVPPTREGIFHATDSERLAGLGRWVEALFSENLLRGARAAGSSGKSPARVCDDDPDSFWMPSGRSGWIELALAAPATFDVISLQEAIRHGQSVERYRVEALSGDRWRVVARGTTIGYRKLDRIAPITASRIRLTIESALDTPRIATVAPLRMPAG